MSQILLLHTLQQIDNAIRSDSQRLSDILSRLTEPAAIATARAAATTAASELAKLQREQRDLELQLGGLNEKFAASHERLYSGKVRSSRELTDLQLEVDSLRQRRGVLEEQLLEKMFEVETATAQRAAADAELVDLEAAWQIEAAALVQQKQELAHALNGQVEIRKAHAARIDATLLRDYLELARRKRGVAVAVLNGNECGACRTSVSIAIYKQVQEGQLTHCGSCDRILVLA